MPFTLDPSAGAELRQGELLADVWVHRAVAPASEIANGFTPDVEQKHHSVAVVIHSDCDLLQDFNARRRAADENTPFDADQPAAVPGVLLCDAFLPNEIHERVQGREFRRRVTQNQEERYHTLEFAPVRIGDLDVDALVLDFRKTFSVDAQGLYAALEQTVIGRVGIVPPIYLHDLMHRCFGYMGRVALP